MKLYFHTDRTDRLRPGDVIQREPYPDESLLAVFSPFWDAEFLRHLTGMAAEGLGLHGHRYLIGIRDRVHFGSMAIEIYYEYIRWKHYPQRPSRLQSFFAWRAYEDALSFAREAGRGRIYEVQCDTPPFMGDMNALKLSLDPAEQEAHARRYWEGKTAKSAADYKPAWECVLYLPVGVVREVMVNPVDGRLKEVDDGEAICL